MAQKQISIPLTQIRVPFHVRTGIDLEHVSFLRDLYESDEPVDPILVSSIDQTKNTNGYLWDVIDGRHRMEACRDAGFNTIQAIRSGATTEKDQILEAVLGNIGGAKPPTLADLEHSMELLIAQKMSKKDILENFPLPRTVTQKVYKLTLSKIYKRTVRNAVDAVLKGNITVKQAAEKYNCQVEDIKRSMQGKKQREESIDNLLSGVEFAVRSLSHNWASKAKVAIELFEDGGAQTNDIARFIARVKSAAKKLDNTSKNVIERLEAVIQSNSEKGESVK